jgi:hypothetical protein
VGLRESSDRRQRTELRDELSERLPFAFGQRSARHAQVGRRQHAEGYCFAVPIAAVFRRGLERVSNGMAEIEDAAQPAFAFVGGDDARLDAARLHDRRQQHIGVASEDAFGFAGDAFEQFPARNHAVLHDFVQT